MDICTDVHHGYEPSHVEAGAYPMDSRAHALLTNLGTRQNAIRPAISEPGLGAGKRAHGKQLNNAVVQNKNSHDQKGKKAMYLTKTRNAIVCQKLSASLIPS